MKKIICSAIFILCGIQLVLYSQEKVADVTSTTPVDETKSYYRLRPLDVINVTVYQEPDLTNTVRLDADGTVKLALLGSVSLKGLTRKEAEEKIIELYKKDYLVNPYVTIYITEYSPQSVYIIGEVGRNGEIRFPIEEAYKMTLHRAVSEAGPSRRANLSSIKVKRKMEDGTTKVFEVNLKAIMREKEAKDFPLQNGDIIEVPESIF